MNTRYTPAFSRTLINSRNVALSHRHRRITSAHLLLGLLNDDDNLAVEELKRQGVNCDNLRNALEGSLPVADDSTEVLPGDLTLDNTAQAILQNSLIEAKQAHDGDVGTIHILLALLKEKDTATAAALRSSGAYYDDIQRAWDGQITLTAPVDGQDRTVKAASEFLEALDPGDVQNALEPSAPSDDDMLELPGSSRRTERKAGRGKKKGGDTPFLDKYARDITSEARLAKFDPVIGRDKEIARIAQILSRKKKNNPILIGEPGVGKTAIVEGLAQRIVRKEVPIVLFNKRVMALNLNAMVAGTKYRGEFEERIQGVMEELQEHRDIILFIDEIHTIIGAGGAEGSLDAANILKPALSRGTLQCIGSTTTSEYSKKIEKDRALERRFQKIMVEPTTKAETLEILRQIKGVYENHHHVTYTDEALEACVNLTERYIAERQLPDKAIDALDEAGSRVHMVSITIPTEIKLLEAEVARCQERKADAVKLQKFEEASEWRDREKLAQQQLDEAQAAWEESLGSIRRTVGREEVEETVSMMSGVPVQRVMDSENIRLKGLKEDLLSKVISQDAAVEKLVRAITRNRIGLRDPNKPIGSFIFLGSTGVGKTYLAKQLARYMFGSSDALIRIDMSEYMESFSVSRLVGAPPGYVGYEEGGELTEKVRHKPYSIILLDEIEKANKNIFNLLLQVMDEGRLTDSNGRIVDFKNTIIIITSNCGTKQAAEFSNGIGFGTTDDEATLRSRNREIIEKALKKEFAPEFLNRLDDIILFDPLDRAAIGHIADLEIGQLSQRIAALGYSFTLDDSAREFIIDKGYDKQYGARPLRRAIQTYLEDGLSDYLLADDKPQGGQICVSHPDDADHLLFQAKEA